MIDDKPDMARDDTEFQTYVYTSLRALNEKHAALEVQLERNTEITKGIEEIVLMGRGMFKFAYRVGTIIRWVGGVAAGTMLLVHWFGDSIRAFFR
jgi:hypothetical protein